MTPQPSPSQAAPPGPDEAVLGRVLDIWQIPRLDRERQVMSGTAGGIAREIGIDPSYVRVLFVVLTLTSGFGVVSYLAAWFIMARRTATDEPYEPVQKAATPRMRIVAFVMIAAGLILLTSTFGFSYLGALVWPSVFVGAAIAVGLDHSRLDFLRPVGELQTRTIATRVALGLGLLFAGIVSASFVSLSFWQAIGGIVVAALILMGAALVFAPIVRILGTDLLAERRRRIRSEERADMAAHLHDSVLQTLALIQKRSHDASVVSLARRQERELRTWLFDDKAMNPNLGFRAGLEATMAGVEDMYQLPIDVVVVGDCPTDGDVAALLLAAREAASNAAKHSGAPRVDVFAEVGHETIEVFVRDTGRGFEIAQVDDDRVGVRDSMIGRMERLGGQALVHTGGGAGTEIEFRLPRRVVGQDPETVQAF